MSKKFIAVSCTLLLFSLLTWAGCGDETASGQPCATGEQLNPITETCVAVQCAAGQTFNPVSGSCEDSDGSDNQNGNQDDDGNDYDPDCPFYQDCDDDNDDGGGTVYNPGQDYDPFQPQDPETAVYHSCESSDFAGIEEPKFLLSNGGNYLMAVRSNVAVSNLSLSSTNPRAHFMEQPDEGYAGFIVSLSPQSGQSDAEAVADWVYNNAAGIDSYSATRVGAGESLRTHDNYRAIVNNRATIDTGDAPGVVRDKLVARLFGVAPDALTYDFDDAATADGSGAVLTYMTLWRSANQVIIVGGITTQDRYNQHDGPARFAIEDMAGGTSVALAGESMTDDCISLELRDTTEVDIIVSLDVSGSMVDVQNALVGFSDTLVDILNATDVDWRIGVTGTDCLDIRDDDALSNEFRMLWPDPDTWQSPQPPIPLPIPIPDEKPCQELEIGIPGFPGGLPGMSGGNNGRLMGDGFTTNALEISQQLGMVGDTGLEYTLTMAMAAVDHSLPRTDNDRFKIRPNAAVVLIVITDENEQLFKLATPFVAGSGQTLAPVERAEMEDFIDPWLSYLQRPDVAATVFGLYWKPGTSCDGATDVAHGIDYIVNQTGGQGDSICSPNISQSFADIANASIDITTGLRLVGSPFASSVHVDVVSLDDGSISPLARSIEDGFDFDSSVYSLYFEGPSTPETGQRIIVPYLKWNSTIIPCDSDNLCSSGAKCVEGICR